MSSAARNTLAEHFGVNPVLTNPPAATAAPLAAGLVPEHIAWVTVPAFALNDDIEAAAKTEPRMIFFIGFPFEDLRLLDGIGSGRCQQILGIRLRCLILTLFRVLGKLRDSDGGQDPDNRDNDHQLDKGKALLQTLHTISPLHDGDTRRSLMVKHKVRQQLEMC